MVICAIVMITTLAHPAIGSDTVPVHSLVRLADGTAVVARVAELGIALDNATWDGDAVEFVVSADEQDAMRRAGLHFTVQIADLTAYYAERAATESALWSAAGRDRGFDYGSMGGFYTFDEVVAKLDEMRTDFPGLVTIRQSIGQSIEAREIWMVKISDNADVEEGEPAILMTGVSHAREPGGMATILYYMFNLLENYGTDPEVTYLVDNRELYFVPVLNPDGYVYNESIAPNGGGMWRKNRRDNGGGVYGVDLNRNYGYMWGYDNQGSSPNPSASNYRGTGPFSEPETSSIRFFHQERTIWNAIHFHSYGGYVLHPHSYAPGAYPPPQDLALFQLYGGAIIQMNGYVLGNSWDTLHYLMNGDVTDWCYGEQVEKNTVYGLLIELGTSGDGFWPAPSRIVPIAEENRGPCLYYSWISGSRVMLTNVAAGPEAPRGTWSDVVTAVFNQGLGAAAEDVTVELGSTDPYVLEITNPASFPAIPALGFGDNAGDPNRFLVAADAPLGHAITLDVTVRQGPVALAETTVQVTVVEGTTGIEVAGSTAGTVPAEFAIAARPNPFNPRTELVVDLVASSDVSVRIYDVHGRLVRTLERGVLDAGSHRLQFDGRDAAGRELSSGVYVARLETGMGTADTRLVLLR